MLASISNSFEEAAFSLGGSRWHAFRTVTLPLTVPGLANAFLLLFGCSLADFATPLIFAGSDFPCSRRGLSADHRNVRPPERRDPVAAATGPAGSCSSRRNICSRAFLHDRHRQGIRERAAGLGVCHRGRPSAGVLSLRLRLILYFYALLFYASIVQAFGANETLTLDRLRVIFTEGCPRSGYADHRADRHAARRIVRRSSDIWSAAPSSSAARPWNS